MLDRKLLHRFWDRQLERWKYVKRTQGRRKQFECSRGPCRTRGYILCGPVFL